MAREASTVDGTSDHHFAGTLPSVLVRRIRRTHGEEGLMELLARSGSTRTVAYLDDLTNWIAYDEAMALFAAAAELTGDTQIARRVGEETIAQHAGTPVATLMRSLGSPEEIYRQITQAGSKFTTASVLEAMLVEPGRAVIREQAAPGFERAIAHCDWSKGMMSQPTCLFGLPPAAVTETTCQARGDDACLYEVTWDAGLAAKHADPAEHLTVLEAQLSAMTERLDSLYATAADLIADGEIDSVLARITERAATAVRAPRYLLALRAGDDPEVRCHHSGFAEPEAEAMALRLLDSPVEDLPSTWLVAEVSSHRQSYGRLVAMGDSGFFAQERYLLELYARYAANALDGATALDEAQRGHREAHSLLGLARALAVAHTSDEVAARLVDTVPAIVDADRVAVWLWDDRARAVTCRASSGVEWPATSEMRISPRDTPYLAALIDDPQPGPMFFDPSTDDALVRAQLEAQGGLALIVAPIVGRGEFLGVLTVTVTSDPERLRPRRDLIDLLSGVVAQAAGALQTARLMDQVTYQARHDDLTGLANRVAFSESMELALARGDQVGETVALLFVDLDGFKEVNDAWGHHVGDDVLREVGRRLVATVRSTDTVARLGGDEFGIVLAGVQDPSEIDRAADRVLGSFDWPFGAAGGDLMLSASVGRAAWPADAGEVEALIRLADADMYRAKRRPATR